MKPKKGPAVKLEDIIYSDTTPGLFNSKTGGLRGT